MMIGSILVVLLAAIAALLLSLYILLSPKDRLPAIAFESAAWKSKHSTRLEGQLRIQMVDDLLNNYPLTGKDRTEVVNILGEPDENRWFMGWDMVYWLGPERHPISIDSEWLVLRIDEEQRVIETKVVTD
jgi:hypothetical protein